MKIRQATKADYKNIKTLIGMYPKQVMQSNLPKFEEFFVVLEKTEIIACSALQIYSKRLAEVRSLIVKPEFQGRGIASKLIKECIKKAKSKGIYEVLSITGAVKLFSKQGFKTFGQEKFAMLKVLKGKMN